MKETPHRANDTGASEYEQIDLFGPPPFSAKAPAPATLEGKLLHQMLDGLTIDQPRWLEETGSWRLAASAALLKRLGWPIEVRTVKAPSNTSPGRHHAAYQLSNEVIRKARTMMKGGAHA